jgi:hypothetical protein
MPIRFVNKVDIAIGRVASTLQGHTTAFAGTFTVAPARTGTLSPTLQSHVAQFSGAFQNATRTGTIASTLAAFTPAISGTIGAVSDPQWASSVDQALVVGVPFSLNLDTICTDTGGQPITYSIVSGTLPAGITQSGSRGQTISGTPTTVSATTVTFRADDLSGDADFLARSGGGGVFYSNNFTYRNTAKTLLITSDAELRSSAAQVGGDTSTVVRNTSQFLSGTQSLKLNMPASSNQYGGWNFDFGGIAVSSKLVSKHQFYFQFAYYADSVYRDFFFGPYSTYGGKIAIIEAPNASFDTGEVVLRRLPLPGGYIAAYRIPTSGVTTEFGLNVSAVSDLFFNNFIDRGGSSSTLNAAQLRFGVNYNNKDNNPASDTDYQHSPRLVSNGWFVFEVYVDQINDIVKIWGAPYGSAPELIMGAMNAGLPGTSTTDGGTNPKPLYTGIQLTNYPNAFSNYPSTTTFVGYDELICSDNAINFPGGFALPFPGTASPTGYPPAGTSEN